MARFLPQHQGEFCAIERAESAVDVVEAVTDLLQLQRSEAEWVGVVTDPP
jgi:hypothetical protein